MGTTKKSSPQAATPKFVEEAVEQMKQPQEQSLQEQLQQALKPEPGEVKTVTLLRCLIDEQKKTNALLTGIIPVLPQLTSTMGHIVSALQTLIGATEKTQEQLSELRFLKLAIMDLQDVVTGQREGEHTDILTTSEDGDNDEIEDDDTDTENMAAEDNECDEELPQLRRAARSAPFTGSYAQSVLKNAPWHPGEPRPVILPSTKRAGGRLV